MGKVEEEQSLPIAGVNQQITDSNAGSSIRIGLWLSFRCVFALLLGVSVLLSAVFSLPFFHSPNPEALDPDSRFEGHEIVARFTLDKPRWFLDDYALQLQDDIFDEINVAETKVVIISLEPSAARPNTTEVIFAVDSDAKTVKVSPTAQSLIRANFESILVHQSTLRLATALFGDPLSFDVLNFKGGITVSPIQSAFTMQAQQIHFNFTLNNSIKEIQDNFDELHRELKSGLHLSPYENLYISLTNTKGSTIDPLTIVKSQVLLAVGINPSKSRMKQLAKTITDSHAQNLGLNNTQFGKVKQVSLSSNWKHMLGGSPSPSPSPLPLHNHHQKTNPTPALLPSPSRGERSPVPSPSPHTHKIHKVKAPCPFGSKMGRPPSETQKQNHLSPAVSPPHSASAPLVKPLEVPTASPLPRVDPPPDAVPPDKVHFISSMPSSASFAIPYSYLWALSLCLLLHFIYKS
ncbi:unnamed protein product [Cuscuta campestris]|uniref:DUF7036 domain-containing protein n=2 Tax=Cuscuta sect. Cleistogrammica TaxID=1824901 RepID=A0A484L7L7_9ASTE|nr:hypothetical protein DM860_005892 [Cuscuta australis]VFQ72286.1 unnamed protein product [Cuscuta campestris]